MTLPFDMLQFMAVFTTYNAAIWPVQVVAFALGLAMVGALLLQHPLRERVILAGLAAIWAWNGLIYHLVFFSTVNLAAYGFATLFAIQTALLAFYAFKPNDIRFEMRSRLRTLAFSLIVYAMLVYHVLGIIAGHGLMKGPMFGVAPCPTTIFTIGLLLLARGRTVRWLAIVPLIWAAIGSSAAVLLGVREDYGLAVAGTLFIALKFFDQVERVSPNSLGEP